MIAFARAAWAYLVFAVGIVLLAATCLAWAFPSLVLRAVLSPPAGRKVGRLGATLAFRGYLATMEALGAWRLDLGELDALKDKGALVVAPNHPCLLDAMLVVSRLPNAVCVMKAALLANFLLGPAARLARYVPNDSLRRLIMHSADELRLGGQLLLFPEGTRSSREPVGPFTDAVGAIARHAQVPVQAVIIEASSRFLGKGGALLARPRLPLVYRARLGRVFDPPQDVRAFTAELERYFARELSGRSVPVEMPEAAGAVDAPRLRG
jgi:1-acyl-sn-glycerol-3-phosphate acyltransferase